jgi:hypothetical protein
LDLSKLGSLLTGLAAGGAATTNASSLTAALAALASPGVAGQPAVNPSLSAALAALTGGGGNYSQLMAAALQVAGVGAKDPATVSLADLGGGEVRREQAFDKDALARLAKEAKEKQVADDAVAASVAAASAEGLLHDQVAADTKPPASATAVPMPSLEATQQTSEVLEVAPSVDVVSPAFAAAAVGLPPEMLQQLQRAKEEGVRQLAPTASPEVVAEVAQPYEAPVANAAPIAPVAFTGFTITASSSTQKAPQKDASSVLGILQQAQANIASQRAGGARGMPPGAAPISSDGHSSGKVENSATALEVLHRRLEVAIGTTPEGRKSLEREVLAMLPKLDVGRAVDLVVRSQASEAVRTQELLDQICQVLVAGIPRFGSAHLAKVTGALSAWALAVTTFVDADGRPSLSQDARVFFNAAATEVSLRLMDVAPGDLSRIANSLSSIGLASIKLFASLARAAVARIDRFSTTELVSLVAAFDKARFFHTGLFEALARSLRANINEVAPRDVLKGMTSLAICGVRDDALGQAIGQAHPRLQEGSLSAEEICALAWAFCALDLHHADLFRAAFRALEATEVVSGETLCQLFEIHLTLKAFHPDTYAPYELEDEIVQSLREHYRKYKGGNGHKFKMERTSEKLHESVADLLNEVIEGSVAMQHQTALGFGVDIAATKKRSSTAFMFLDIDGPHTLVRSLATGDVSQTAPTSWRVRGSVLLKRRVIQKHGFRIAAITEDSWNALDSIRDKREHLRGILRNAGVEKDRFARRSPSRNKKRERSESRKRRKGGSASRKRSRSRKKDKEKTKKKKDKD